MANYTTKTNTPTVYRIKRSLDEQLGLGWLYNFTVSSNLFPGDTSFYRIEGVKKNDETSTWKKQPFVTITFLRATGDGEEFSINSLVKILSQNTEICEQVVVGTVTVEELDENLICTNLYTDNDCIIAGEDYVYKFCCEQDNPLDEVIFTVENARVFNLNGVEYMNTNNISVTTFQDNCASIIVRWKTTDPVSPGYKISAYGRRNQTYSDVVTISNIFAIPSVPNVSIISENSFVYGSGLNEMILRLSRITRYPSNYKIRIDYRENFIFENTDLNVYGDWDIHSLSYISDFTPSYTHDYTHNLDLTNPYQNGDAVQYEIEFRISIYRCIDELDCDGLLECDTISTIKKTIDLVYCQNEITFGDFIWIIDKCVDEITYGTITWEYTFCYDTVWTYSNICRIHCFDTIWNVDLNNSCTIFCFDTIWNYSDICRIYCFDTIWNMNSICSYLCLVNDYYLEPCYDIKISTIPTKWKLASVGEKNPPAAPY